MSDPTIKLFWVVIEVKVKLWLKLGCDNKLSMTELGYRCNLQLSNKLKQAGAELGQAQSKLGLNQN